MARPRKPRYEYGEKLKLYRKRIKDSDGNDIFGMSFVAGKPCISKNGVTFGAVNADGLAIVTGDIPEKLPEGTPNAGEYVADVVGAALAHVNALEASLPEVVATIKTERAALIGGITNA